MSINKQLSNSDLNPEQSRSEESVKFFLDRLEEEQDKEDFEKLIDVLLKIIHPGASEKFFFSSNILKKIISQRSIIFFIIVFSIIAPSIVIADTTNLVLWLVGIQAIIIIVAFVSILNDIKKLILSGISSPEDKTETTFKKIMNEFMREQAAVKLLRNTIISEEKLKRYEIEMEKQVRKTQVNEKVIYNILLSVPLLITFITIYIYGEQAFKSFNNLSLVSLKLPLLALYPIIVGMVNSLIFRSEIDKLNKCLSCLKKAQVKPDEREHQLEKAGNKESFMERFRKISIDAPADFSVNYEKYIRGEERID